MRPEFAKAFELLATSEANRAELAERREMNKDYAEPLPRRQPEKLRRAEAFDDARCLALIAERQDAFMDVIAEAFSMSRREERQTTDTAIAELRNQITTLEVEVERLRAEVSRDIVTLPRSAWTRRGDAQ